MLAYRLFRVEGESPATLFHAWHRSRTLPLDKPLRAPDKQVWNPGPGFRSGWHVFLTRAQAERLRKRFKRPQELVVCRVLVQEVWPKPRTNVDAYLARTMTITTADWKQATS
jgi:hypothetical protein